ncbi:MAG: hypothetical protein EAZ55_03310 [Cytophagales bacterium]|nr:MAG: hypothetical protein EAZ55_03310 [Cytophagales bacterium]
MKKFTLFCLLVSFFQITTIWAQVGSQIKLSKIYLSADNYVREVHFDINGKTLRVFSENNNVEAPTIYAEYTGTMQLLKAESFKFSKLTMDGKEEKSINYFRLFNVTGEKDFSYFYIVENGNNNFIYQVNFSQEDPTESAGYAGQLNFEFVPSELSIVEYLEGSSVRWWSFSKANSKWIGGGSSVAYDVQGLSK